MVNRSYPAADRFRPDWIGDIISPVTSVPERALIRVLAISNRRGLDPGPLVESLAAEFPGKHGYRMHRLALQLASGDCVVDALEKIPGVVSPSTAISLRLAGESSSMDRMFESLLQSETFSDPREIGGEYRVGPDVVRATLGFGIAALVLTFMMLYIVPTFEQMFSEFGLDLPTSTAWLIESARFFAEFGGFFALPLMLVVLAILGASGYRFLSDQLNPLTFANKHAPKWMRSRSLLAILAQSGRPLVEGLNTIAKFHQSRWTRSRFAKVCRRIEEGQDAWTSLASGRVINQTEARALAKAESGQTQAWLLGWFISSRQRFLAARSHLFIRLVSLAGTLVLGIVVAFSVISLFMPLVSLIIGLS